MMSISPRKIRCWCLLVLSGAILYPGLTAQPLRFTQETIQMRIADRFCVLDGLYQFENYGPQLTQHALFYPFAEPADAVDSIRVTDLSRQTEGSFVQRPSGISFAIEVPPYSTRVYRVQYRQYTPRRRFEYILTTTEKWGEPLERAVIRVVVPDTLTVTGISFAPDSTVSANGVVLLHLDRREFLPDRNFVIQWKRRPP